MSNQTTFQIWEEEKPTRYCRNCGHAVSLSRRYCEECGAPTDFNEYYRSNPESWKAKKATQKPEIGKAILFAVVALIAFYICFFVLALGITLVFGLLLKISLIKNLVEFLFYIRGDSPGIFAILLAAAAAYAAAVWVIRRFCDVKATENLTLRIAGILLLAFNILFLIINIKGGQETLPNIVIGIVGLVMIIRSRS